MDRANHRVIAGSRLGRSITQAKGARVIDAWDKQHNPHEEYNRMIDEKKAAKKAAKLQKDK